MMYDHTSTTGCSMCSRGGMSTGTSVGRMVLFPRTMEIPTDLFDAVREGAMGVADTARQGVMTVSDLFTGITMLDGKYKSITDRGEDFLEDVVKTVKNPLKTVTDTASPAAMAAVAVPTDVFNILRGVKMM